MTNTWCAHVIDVYRATWRLCKLKAAKKTRFFFGMQELSDVFVLWVIAAVAVYHSNIEGILDGASSSAQEGWRVVRRPIWEWNMVAGCGGCSCHTGSLCTPPWGNSTTAQKDEYSSRGRPVIPMKISALTAKTVSWVISVIVSLLLQRLAE